MRLTLDNVKNFIVGVLNKSFTNKKELDKYEEYYINKYKPKYNYLGVYIRYKKAQRVEQKTSN